MIIQIVLWDCYTVPYFCFEKRRFMEELKFEELELCPEILKAVKHMGFEEASPIQSKAIPVIMSGKDVIGQAQTGTGKTAAFGIPLLEKIDPKNKKLQAIVLCPTRELAIQVAEEIRNLAKYMHGIKVLPIYGGQEIVKQIRSLKSGTQLVIGTPGRVMDHMRRKTMKMDHVHTIVLDEADEMLNMGFREDIETILEGIPQEHQTVLFSATMPKAILEITKQFQTNAELVKVTKKELTVPNIEQFYYEVKPKNKEEVLSRLLDIYTPKLSVVFCNTKKQVDLLVNGLLGRGYFAAGHYVHRIGRTGRAGRVGRSFSFVSGREVYKLKEIQRYCKTKIYAQKVPSLNDVANTKMENVLEEIEQIIENEDLTKFLQIIEERVNESDYTAMDLAAAFLKYCSGQQETEEKDMEFGDTGAEEAGMVRLFINIGKKNKAKPGDIVGAIAGESGIPGKLIGTIDMFDKYTFVEVPREYARDVLNAMNHTKIKGKSVAVEPANQK